ncbi:MAG: bifunctional polysaccharide deacetylase/glycosyltransferase family 2 protein, partial [Solirubrobacteraceae bacterium]|nr:bifunctional polysaccharide deacetylase/glycosyltransferase family 2 protein [Solirubrobacteraceae bacterium]
ATHTIGAGTETAVVPGSKAPLVDQGAVFTADRGRLVPARPKPGRRIALTFDDGPDPRWTPAIAEVLRRHGVKATFFLVGSQAARHPELVRMLQRDGHDIGNHTFTHVSLDTGSEWQRRKQLEITEATIAGITGRYARFVRPPYSATSDAVTPAGERALATLAGQRYFIALSDIDSRDWLRPGTQEIVDNVLPQDDTGGVVLMHDGGGDRSETVAALEILIPQLRARGFRFASMSRMSGVPRAVSAPPASAFEQRRAQVFAFSVRLAFSSIGIFGIVIFAIGALVALRAVLLLTLATHHVRTTRRPGPDGEPEFLPQVTVLVPAYNEEVGIEQAVRSLAAGDYPDLDVLVIDDGSKDGTSEVVAGLGLPNVRLIRQDNGGKSAALNTGIAHSNADVLVMVDGDTLFEPDTIRQLVAPLRDPDVGAVSGNTKVGNRSGLLGRWQHIEYVMGFNLDRRMYEVLQCTPTVPGAIGAFRREVLLEVGGVPADTLAEDTDLTLAIGRTGRRVVYAESARAWTEAPSTLTALWRQRYRWSFGTMQAVWKHRGAVFSRDPLDRKIGRRALPYMFVFQIVLPVLAPLIDLYAIYGILFTDPARVGLSWLAFNVVQMVIAMYGFRLDRESWKPLWALPLQQFVYRQLMYLVIIESTVTAIQGVRSGWKHLPRTGDAVIVTATASDPA